MATDANCDTGDASDDAFTEVTNAERVVRFLSRNDDRALTPAEIAEGAGVKKSSISTVLRRLHERDLVRHRGDYWAIGDEEMVRDAVHLHRLIADLDEQPGAESPDEWRDHAASEGE